MKKNLDRPSQGMLGVATWVGTRLWKSSQDTRPRADHAGTWKAEKKKKTAHRGSLSLDKGSPHKGSAWVLAPTEGLTQPAEQAFQGGQHDRLHQRRGVPHTRHGHQLPLRQDGHHAPGLRL